MVAMTLFAWRRDQCRKTVEQLHRRQHQTDASSRTGASCSFTPDVRDRRPQATPSHATVPAQRPGRAQYRSSRSRPSRSHASTRTSASTEKPPPCSLSAIICESSADPGPADGHLASDGIGWSAFSLLVERSPLPVHALRGLQPEMLETAGKRGGHGIALMRGWR
jgi:hypothetical protein